MIPINPEAEGTWPLQTFMTFFTIVQEYNSIFMTPLYSTQCSLSEPHTTSKLTRPLCLMDSTHFISSTSSSRQMVAAMSMRQCQVAIFFSPTMGPNSKCVLHFRLLFHCVPNGPVAAPYVLLPRCMWWGDSGIRLSQGIFFAYTYVSIKNTWLHLHQLLTVKQDLVSLHSVASSMVVTNSVYLCAYHCVSLSQQAVMLR